MSEARHPALTIIHAIGENDDAWLYLRSLPFPHQYEIHRWASPRLFQDRLESMPQGCIVIHAGEDRTSVHELQRALDGSMPGMPMIILADEFDVEAAVDAMRLGAVDIIPKPFDPVRLLGALTAAEMRLDKSRRRSATLRRVRAVLDLLTEREKDVLAGLTRGLSNKEIARELEISSRTVDIHRANMMRKLDAESLSQALRIAFIAEICGQYNPTLHVQ